jgi:NAD-dependent SIR2 family protein deacetylase
MEKVKCIVCDQSFEPEQTYECVMCKKPVCPDCVELNAFGGKDIDLCENCLAGEPLEIIHFLAGYCNTLNEIIEMYRNKCPADMDEAVARLFADLHK